MTATISRIDETQRKAAKVAGLSGLFTMATAVFAQYAISPHLFVAGDTAATGRNILAHEGLFRLSIACHLVYGAGIVVLLTALYLILQPVSRGLAMLAAFWRLVYGLMWALVALNSFDVLRVLGGAEYLQAPALAKLYLGRGFDVYYVGLPFYGLASTMCSWLWLKSGYVPRAMAAFGVIASLLCVACGFAFIVVPNFAKILNPYWYDSPMGIFEMVLSVWLLVKGLRPRAAASS